MSKTHPEICPAGFTLVIGLLGVIFVLLLPTVPVFAQTWQMVQPVYTGSWFEEQCFLDDSVAWLPGANLLLTTDQGRTWQGRNPAGLNSYAHFFRSRNEGWIGKYNEGQLYHTTDGGLNWQLAQEFDLQGSRTIRFADSAHGWVVGQYWAFYRTRDGGVSWERRPLPVNDYVVDWVVVDSQRVWFITYMQQVWSSTDGGDTWSPIIVDTVASLRISALSFVDSLNGWTVGNIRESNHNASSRLYRTTDGGTTWSVVPTDPPDSTGFVDVRFVDHSRGVITQDNNTLRITEDGGLTWRHQMAPRFFENNAWISYAFPDWSQWWVQGAEGIWFSSDQGATWNSRLTRICEYAYDIHFQNQHSGWIGADDRLLHTTDGGFSWTVAVEDTNRYFNKIQFWNDQVGWAISSPMYIYRTTDGGQSWTPFGAATRNAISGLSFCDALNGWAVCSDGFTARTVDGGQTWTPYWIDQTVSWWSIHFMDSLHCWLGAGNGRVYYTVDGGQTWLNQRLSWDGGICDLTFLSLTEGWAATYAGEIFHTTNGGADWSTQLSTSHGFTDLDLKAVGNSVYGWATSNYQLPFTTTDGGAHWTVVDAGYGMDWSAVSFTDSQHVWFVRNFGGVLRYESNVSPAAERAMQVSDFSLDPPYPNPFNAVTTLRYALPKESDVQLAVWDITGRRARIRCPGTEPRCPAGFIWSGCSTITAKPIGKKRFSLNNPCHDSGRKTHTTRTNQESFKGVGSEYHF
jgi:photosystem II stability/assembly factor-like uncharacterized protein